MLKCKIRLGSLAMQLCSNRSKSVLVERCDKEVWEKSENSKIIILKSEHEKAFCAGGDVKSISSQSQKDGQPYLDFFKEEYRLNYLFHNLKTPLISLMNGITMGGGVGISAHAPFRIATEKTRWAMPETSIGFIPDVGATYFLPRIENQSSPLDTHCTPENPSPIGVYLALTGHEIKGIDCYWLGIATHYIPSTSLSLLEERLSELDHDDSDIVNLAIEEFCYLPKEVSDNNDSINKLFKKQKWILKHFHYRSLNDIFSSLLNVSRDESDEEYKKWALDTVTELSKKSPSSMIVTLESLYQNSRCNLSECLQKELHLVNQFLLNKDFYTGVEAVLLKKSKDVPAWEPILESIKNKDIESSIIDQYFNKPTKEIEIDFGGQNKGVTSCAFSRYSLPHITMVEKFITGYSKDSGNSQHKQDEVLTYFKKKFNDKIGVELKINSIIKEFCQIDSDFLKWKD